MTTRRVEMQYIIDASISAFYRLVVDFDIDGINGFIALKRTLGCGILMWVAA